LDEAFQLRRLGAAIDPPGWSVLVDSLLTPMVRVWNFVGLAGTTLVSCPMSQTDTEGKIDSSTDQK
jgi:hypothetical protein